MQKVIQLKIPFFSNDWDFTEFNKLKPEEIELSINPNDFLMESVMDTRLPIGNVLECELDGGYVYITIKDNDEIRLSNYHTINEAILCCGNLARTVTTELGYVKNIAGNYMFLFWGVAKDPTKIHNTDLVISTIH